MLAVLGYQIVNYWLPLLRGAVAYLRLRLRSATASLRETSTPQSGRQLPPAFTENTIPIHQKFIYPNGPWFFRHETLCCRSGHAQASR